MKHLNSLFGNKPLVGFSRFILLAGIITVLTSAGDITFTLVKAPCDKDGILAIHYTGTLPTTILWSMRHPYGYAKYDTITTPYDTLYGYNGDAVMVYGGGDVAFYPGAQPIKFYLVNEGPYGSVVSAVCPQRAVDSVSIISGIPPFTYDWRGYDNNSVPVIATTKVVTLPPGSYTLKITDGNGCTAGAYGYTGYTGDNDHLGIYSKQSSNVDFEVGTTAPACVNGKAWVSNVIGAVGPYDVVWNDSISSGDTVTGLTPGYYNVKVSDSLGCGKTSSFQLMPPYPINVSTNTNPATCLEHDGRVSTTTAGGFKPYSYLWSNGIQTSFLDSVPAGQYRVVVTDSNQCTTQTTARVNTHSPLSANFKTVKPRCGVAGNATVFNISNGTPPYQVQWSTEPPQTTTTAYGLLANKDYSFTITDSVGCTYNRFVYLLPGADTGCEGTIKGKVYIDANANCQYDSSEVQVPGAKLYLKGIGYTFTDQNGEYKFGVSPGNYKLVLETGDFYNAASCQLDSVAITITPQSLIAINNLATVSSGIEDVEVFNVSMNVPRPGFTYKQQLVVKNNDAEPKSTIQLRYLADAHINLIKATPALFTQPDSVNLPNWYSITNGFPLVPAFGSVSIGLEYYVPANVLLGSNLVFNDTTALASPLESWTNETFAANNINKQVVTVVGAYDPNYKEVLPQGFGAPGYITRMDSLLTYTIHFQNTGTYMADFVVIKDTLDSDLDITTLQPVYGSHKYNATISETGVLTFTFDNIMLPDSGSDFEGSNGYVMYKAKMKKNLADGTRISSPASIYFDYNLPVQTNAAINTLDFATEIYNEGISPFDFKLQPNPASGQVQVAVHSSEAGTGYLKFYNVVGELVQQQEVVLTTGNNILQASVNPLPSGMYFAELCVGKYAVSHKLSVVK